ENEVEPAMIVMDRTFTKIPPTLKVHECSTCQAAFPTRNKLFKHINNVPKKHQNPALTIDQKIAPVHLSVAELEKARAKRSTVVATNIGHGLSYRGFTYLMMDCRLSADSPTEAVCGDTGCTATLADEDFILRQVPNVIWREMAVPLRVRGIANNVHETSRHAILDLRFPGVDSATGEIAEAVIQKEVHVVKNLTANMLLGNDFLVPERVLIDLEAVTCQIRSCGVTIALSVRPRAGLAIDRKPIHLLKGTRIEPQSTASLSIHQLPDLARDFLFEPDEVDHVSLFTHILNQNTQSVLAKNDTDKPIVLKRGMRLGRIFELDQEVAATAAAFAGISDSELLDMAERPPRQRQDWFKKGMETFASAFRAASFVTTVSSSVDTINDNPVARPTTPPTLDHQQTTLPNGATVFGSQSSTTVGAVSRLIDDYPDVFTDQGTFVDIPRREWMKIPLRHDWQNKLPAKGARVYPVGNEGRKVIDDTFDKLQREGRMSWTKTATPFSYPVFVVWKTKPNGERQGRAVVDIRGLNAISLPDVYPVPLQSEMISLVSGSPFITVIDCASFFYQWRVDPRERHKLTVVTHRGQEQFNVAVMGYRNSVSYVQRQIDTVLRDLRKFARAYIDDCVIFSSTLNEHLHHLEEVFKVFRRYNISINPKKAFLAFPSVKLLGQHIDSFGLATAEDKLKAISQLHYPETLSQLEGYLGLTGWLRQYVPFYAAIAEPLQRLKTLLLKDGPDKGAARKNYSLKTPVPAPSPSEQVSFEELQKALSKPTYLVHYSPKRQLYIDVDSSIEFGIGAMVYHVRDGVKLEDGQWPGRTSVEPILFLSRLLNPAEKKYWPTELEIAGAVWALRKIRHLAESSDQPPVVFTDHNALLGIYNQKSLETESTERANLLLVRAGMYLQQFRIKLLHKPG
ncbi:MAG: reverse transcriptase domain-containing protein, partial [Janthinobacterium lividum]